MVKIPYPANPKPYPASFTPASDYARLYVQAYRAARPDFSGWLPGVGWGRLSGWLSCRKEFDHLPVGGRNSDKFGLADLTDHVAAAVIEAGHFEGHAHLLAADHARLHSPLPPRRPER